MSTQIFLNGRTFKTQSIHLNELLSLVRTTALQRGEVITDVRVDGESVAVEKDADFAHFILSDLERVEIETRDVRKVTLEGLAHAHKNRLFFIEKTQEITSHCRRYSLEENWQAFSNLVQRMEFVIMMFSSYASFFSLQNKAIIKQISEIKNVLESLPIHIERKHYVELADALEYELLPLFTKLLETIPDLLRDGSNTSH